VRKYGKAAIPNHMRLGGKNRKRISLSPGTWLAMTLLLGSMGAPALAQSVQFLPEIDAHVTVSSFLRTYVEAKDDRDAGASDQFSIGPSVQFFLKPLLKLKKITAFDLDDAKPRPLVLEVGYRYLTAPNAPPTERMEPMLTFHLPLKAGSLLSDRNRADLDWKNGKFAWRYRNRLTVERTFGAFSYHFIPYVAAEPYYVEQYNKWSTTALYAGCLLPAVRHFQFNFYYEHENNTGKRPNQQQNSIGLALNLYYSVETK
jgi:hypothetical protein